MLIVVPPKRIELALGVVDRRTQKEAPRLDVSVALRVAISGSVIR